MVRLSLKEFGHGRPSAIGHITNHRRPIPHLQSLRKKVCHRKTWRATRDLVGRDFRWRHLGEFGEKGYVSLQSASLLGYTPFSSEIRLYIAEIRCVY